MTHNETYQTDKFGDLLMLVTGGTNYTMAEEHLLYRKALRAVVELHKPYESKPHKPYSTLYCNECTDYSTANWPCATIQAIEKELSV